MTWFKVDDSLPDHPKMVRLQAMKNWQKALALWTLAGAWASRHLTDGQVPAGIVLRLGCDKRDAEMLVKAGLWHAVEGGYAFHAWAERNPLRTDVETKREKTRVRVADWRRNAATGRVTDQGADESTDRVERIGNAVTYSVTNASPVPSRPVPSGDPLTSFAISSGAREFLDPTAGQVRTRFESLFTERFGMAPYMGGGEVIATFPARLRDTATKKNVDALGLLGQTFEAWAAKPLDEISQNAPYAAFAARFGSLCSPKGGSNGGSELDALHAAQVAALEAKDLTRYASLCDEEKRRVGRAAK